MRGYAALLILMVSFAGALPATALMIAEQGAARAEIVLRDDATVPEHTAAGELAAYLGQAVGTAFSVVTETAAASDKNHIHVGFTAAAKGLGIDSAAFGPEEWIVRTHGNDLVLAGGRPRGTLYAVYHFLEDEVGVHWWNPY
jgi:hypothetical protein